MEINKCLEDPNTQYSDQYMPLAMMPAVIEAIQQGGGSGGSAFLIITADDDTNALSKTASEIITALESGKLGILQTANDTGSSCAYGGLFTEYTLDDRTGKYLFTMYPFGQAESWQYSATTLNDYPVPVE